jgi:hypothetical protein
VRLCRYVLSTLKAFCCVGPQLDGSVFMRTSKNGKPRSADLDMNLFNATNLPASLCASLRDVGGSN